MINNPKPKILIQKIMLATLTYTLLILTLQTGFIKGIKISLGNPPVKNFLLP